MRPPIPMTKKWLIIDGRLGVDDCYFAGWIYAGSVRTFGNQDTMWSPNPDDMVSFDSYEEAVIERGLINNLDPLASPRMLGVQPYMESA